MEAADREQPHMALFFVLEYLPLFDLLNMSRVCRSMRDYIQNDVLVWLDIVVDRPLNRRLTDDVLMEIVSKARGRLRTLALLNCETITDDGIQKVVEENPLIEQLFLPGCTGLTPEGVINSVRTLTESKSCCLKALKISGIYNITKEHLGILSSYLNINIAKDSKLLQPRNANKSPLLHSITHYPYPYIDVEICHICKEVKMVFDCPRENCKCKGCNHCIRRCKECGVCGGGADQDGEELEEAVCGDDLCLNCWLMVPKCSQCNRPYCRQHMLAINDDTFGQCNDFVCEICRCRDEYEAVADYEI